MAFTRDHLGRQTNFSYQDSFSDGNNSRNTFAYPTTVTDPGGFSSTMQYNFDFGAVTRTQGPPPAGQSQGAIQTLTYDSAARVDRVTSREHGRLHAICLRARLHSEFFHRQQFGRRGIFVPNFRWRWSHQSSVCQSSRQHRRLHWTSDNLRFNGTRDPANKPDGNHRKLGAGRRRRSLGLLGTGL